MDPHLDDARGELNELTRQECLGLLGAHGVGRIGVIDHGGMPLIVPVNYRLVGAHVVFRSEPGTKVFALQRHPVAFQIDGFDTVNRTGWSVLVQGIAHEMSESERAELVVQPWAKGDKSLWIQIVPRHITGRRLIDPTPFESPGGYL